MEIVGTAEKENFYILISFKYLKLAWQILAERERT